ncbi:hypothetical protein BGZ96_009482 [Linnemannia gamsii]|uniref:Zinc metalloprotease n=1 Tax=Linnemannia gamsii TaxID=64522 RepID=A0ABQ7JW55_9FUNG|nr:hypothetical protein BGZ96_009482 [Linnemannia gamsii]
MVITGSITALLAVLFLATFTSAHSHAWPIIAYTETLGPLHHEILPRHRHNNPAFNSSFAKRGDSSAPDFVEKDDKIRLRFQAFNKTFFLHLEPNHDLLHPDLLAAGAHSSALDAGSSSRMTSSSSVYDDIKPFKGVVVEDDYHSNQKWERAMSANQAVEQRSTVEQMLFEEGVLGWARMMIEHDEDDNSIILRGAFTTKDDTYHITSHQHYHIQKRSDDHSPPSTSSPTISSQLIIYRDSDLHKPNKKLYVRRDEEEAQWEEQQATTCGSGFIANKVTNNNINNSSGSWLDAVGREAEEEQHGYYYPPDLTAHIPVRGGQGGAAGPSSFFNMAATTFRKRSSPENNIMVKMAGPNPVPTGCPINRMVNYMGVAADCTYVRSYGGLANARKQIFADFNTASGIYESTFNIALGIIAVQIESMNCPKTPVKGKAWNQECSTNYTISDRLSDFSYWRGQRAKDGAGLWHLMTQCSSGPIVGIAWTGALCQMSAQSQGGGTSTGSGATASPVQFTSGTGVSSISPNEWMVVSHEIGHGFGASHDCTAASCVSASAVASAACCPYSTGDCDAGSQFIMNPSEQLVKSNFSPCSIHAICSTFAKAGSCLQPVATESTKSAQSLDANVCGNGIREEGEQCDCGTPAECAFDPCCDGTTCKFKGSAVCDDMNDDCCHNCQLAPKGQICRSAVSNCDIAETCSGSSAICPPDVQVPNLTSCDIPGTGNLTGKNRGQCADGLCTSRDLQCAQQQRPGINKQCAAAMSQCELLCNDPDGAKDLCMKIPGMYFVDGSPCGTSSNGICVSGKCVLPGGWVRNNLSIFIPIICLVIVLIGAGIGTWVFLSRRKARRSIQPRLSTHVLPALPPHTDESGRSNGVGGGSSGTPMAKSKDADVPKWMFPGDRPNTQVVISRRASLSSQNVLRNAEGDVVPMSTAPELAAIYMQQQPQLQNQFQHHPQHQHDLQHQRDNDYAYREHYQNSEPYRNVYQSHEELHQQQLRQHQYLQQTFGYLSPTGFMSPAPAYSPGFPHQSPTIPSKQEFVEQHEQYMSSSPLPRSGQSPQMQGQGQGQGHLSPLMQQQHRGRSVSPQHIQQAHHRSHHLNLQQQQQQPQLQRYQYEHFNPRRHYGGNSSGSHIGDNGGSSSRSSGSSQQPQQQPHERHHQ